MRGDSRYNSSCAKTLKRQVKEDKRVTSNRRSVCVDQGPSLI